MFALHLRVVRLDVASWGLKLIAWIRPVLLLLPLLRLRQPGARAHI
jgi:hypothetical protein